MAQLRHLVVHHSATPDGRVNDWMGICRFHTSWRRMDRGEIVTREQGLALAKEGVQVVAPWRGPCGYHRGVELVNGLVVVQRGRELWESGAHCEGFNYRSVGLCVVGCYDKTAPPEAVWKAAVEQAAQMCHELKQDVREMVTGGYVIGHRESYPLLKKPVQKTCPGAAFDMDRFRRDLLALA